MAKAGSKFTIAETACASEAARNMWVLGLIDELLELMELRYGTGSTVFCMQFRKKGWHARLGGGVHADAIMDRIVHNATWVDMGETNMRQRRSDREREES